MSSNSLISGASENHVFRWIRMQKAWIDLLHQSVKTSPTACTALSRTPATILKMANASTPPIAVSSSETNALGQPVGLVVPDWTAPVTPHPITLQGAYCRLEPLNTDLHAVALFAANSTDVAGRMWTYLSDGPFAEFAAYEGWMLGICKRPDLRLFAIVDGNTQKPVGAAAYLRIQPEAGSIEVGHLMYSPLLQRSRAATEAMYLLMTHAFSLGYRRYEWKCNALNGPSRKAALRLGFVFEGVFRQAMISKGRNRDTAWFSIIDSEWPALQSAFRQWLNPANFDAAGRQRESLSSLTAALGSDRP
jgi:RimJ/RimL family protein N-acetyltransferase